MDALAPFRIPVATLKADHASFEWKLGPEFLAIFDDQHETEKGTFTVRMLLERTGGITTLYFNMNGIVDTPCDRCMAQINLPVEGEYQVIVKFGDPTESTDEVVVVDPESPALNVGTHIYDFILLSIPISRRIPGCDSSENPPCDMTVLSFLTTNQENENPNSGNDDPLWEDLKKVIDN